VKLTFERAGREVDLGGVDEFGFVVGVTTRDFASRDDDADSGDTRHGEVLLRLREERRVRDDLERARGQVLVIEVEDEAVDRCTDRGSATAEARE